MGIKPALGWLGLLLFTTTAQAEGTRELLKGPSSSRPKSAPITMTVTPKTKAPGPVLVNASSPRASLSVVETVVRPHGDYDATTHAGAPLDSAIARERGLEGGLVQMVFEHRRTSSFHVARERIRRVVRLAAERPLGTAHGGPPGARAEHVDVLDTDDGVVVVDTASTSPFVTSDVYVFPRRATLEQRIGAVEVLTASEQARSRVREALAAAEWMSPVGSAK